MQHAKSHARAMRGATIICLTAFLSGCVAEQTSSVRTSSTDQQVTSNLQPRLATYRCGDGDMTIEISDSSAHVVDPRGLQADLMASPPGQRNRFSDAFNALVVEGKEALWMANRKEPLTCQR